MQAYIFKRGLKMGYNIKADEALEYWLSQKTRRLSRAKPRNFPAEGNRRQDNLPRM